MTTYYSNNTTTATPKESELSTFALKCLQSYLELSKIPFLSTSVYTLVILRTQFVVQIVVDTTESSPKYVITVSGTDKELVEIFNVVTTDSIRTVAETVNDFEFAIKQHEQRKIPEPPSTLPETIERNSRGTDVMEERERRPRNRDSLEGRVEPKRFRENMLHGDK